MMVDPGELRDVFDRAASLPPVDRAAFLAQACAQNDALRREVERLLDADARGGSAFDTDRTGEAADSSNEGSNAPRMSLVSGTRLGPYQITAALGAGGMGEVYKARDTRLDRTVALKILPRELTRDATARHRLEREARAAASLNHPHICTLLDIGRQDDVDFLVMEYLDGETLAGRLGRGILPFDQALVYAVQISEALSAAHRAGIVHRDLKPGNVMLTETGAKLLDFGLAKQRPRSVVGDTTGLRAPLTRTGTILGTVQYMAPEQLDGLEADERTDVFAFGVVLYEMATGQRAFQGSTDASLIGHILHGEPAPPSSVNPLSPRALDRLVRQCLAKKPSERLQSIDEVREHLAVLLARNRGRGDGHLPTVRRVPRLHPRTLAIAAVILIATLALTLKPWRWLAPSAPNALSGVLPVQRNLTRLTFDAGLQADPSFSPDGRFVVYASDKTGNFDLWVQPVAGGNAVQVTRSPAHDMQPSWSPDGSAIVFRSERDGGGLYLVPALGGQERRLADFGHYPSWSADGKHVRFLTHDYAARQLFVVSRTAGTPRQLMPEFAAKGVWYWIAVRPDGRVSFLGALHEGGYGFYTVSEDGAVTSSDLTRIPEALNDMVHNGNQRFRWNDDGTALLLETDANNGVRNLWRVTVDPSTLAWSAFERLTTGPGADVTASRSMDGRHVVFSTQRISDRLWRFPLAGENHKLPEGRPFTEDYAVVLNFDVSPDARNAAFFPGRPGSRDMNLWWMPLEVGRPEMLVESAAFPRWSPVGRQIAYIRIREETINKSTGTSEGIIAVREPGGPERQITAWEREHSYHSDWSPDGRSILAAKWAQLALWTVGDRPSSTPDTVVLSGHGNYREARYSPDGRWLSVLIPDTSSRRQKLFVTSANGPPERKLVPVAPAHLELDRPRWASDGKRLYFLSRPSEAFLDVWAMTFDGVRGVPTGEPFRVTHFDSPAFRISPGLSWTGMEFRGGWLFLTMRTTSGNLWMLDNMDK